LTTLSRWAFPNGNDYNGNDYYEKFNAQKRQDTIVVHNNFMVGHDKKRDHFIQEGLWNVEKEAIVAAKTTESDIATDADDTDTEETKEER
jgi:hypothetical protein